LRYSPLVQHLADGRITQDDFELETHRAIILAAQEYIRVVKNSGLDVDIIPIGPLCEHISIMKASGAVQPHFEDALIGSILAIYNMPLSPEYYGARLKDFIQTQRFNKALRISKKEGITSPEEVNRRTTAALDSFKVGTEASIVSSPLIDFDFSEENDILIPTNIEAVNRGLRGGLAKKEVGIICGLTGLGKTTLAMNFGWGAASNGFRVAFATLELTKKKMSARLYSLIGNMPYDLCLRGDVTGGRDRREVNEQIREAASRNAHGNADKFLIWDFSDQECTVPKLKEYLVRARNDGAPIDLLIVDWMDCMNLPPSTDRGDKSRFIKELRHKLGEISSELAKLAVTENVAMWVMTQSNSKAENQRNVGMSNASEGFSKAFKCSVFLGLGADRQDRQTNIFTLTSAKNRDGQMFTCRLLAQLDQQRFIDHTENAPSMEEASQLIAANPNRMAGSLVPVGGPGGMRVG
jgi:hypothetical protein